MLIQHLQLQQDRFNRTYKSHSRTTIQVSSDQTNIIRLVGDVPGAGKSTTLVYATIEAYRRGWARLVILAKDNLAVQNIKLKFEELGINWRKICKIMTMKSFKRNYKRFVKETPRFDPETGEIKDVLVSEDYITCHSKKHYKMIYNILIDECGNISNIEIEDLLENWRVNNLVLCGDANQFKPIPGKNAEYFGEDLQEEWNDDGSLFTERGKTILLNKSFRSLDPKLTKVVESLKNATFETEDINLFDHDEDVDPEEFLRTVTHIAYTNKECQAVHNDIKKAGWKTDDLYYIIKFPDFENDFMKNDRIKLTDERIQNLRSTLFDKAFAYFVKTFELEDFGVEEVQAEADRLWEEWKENHLELAQAVTCHKMQGTTTEDAIMIHLDDFLSNVTFAMGDNLNEEEQAKQLQTFLYVSISRARRASQIWFKTCGDFGLMKKFRRLVSLMKPMQDETIRREDIVYEGPSGKDAVEALLDNLRPDDECNVTLEGQEEYQRRICKANQHYTDADIELSIRLSFKEFKEATGLTSSRTFAKLRKLAKERNLRP